MVKDRKSIVFLNQSSGYLMIDIVNAFRDRYDERILLTGFLNPRKTRLDSDVKVEKLASYNRGSTLRRITTWLFAFLKALYLIKVRYRHSDLFLVSNPPLSVFIPLFCRNKSTFLIYDIYPDTFAEFNLLKRTSMLVKLWERANAKVFAKAEQVFTLTQEMKAKLEKYVEPQKIKVVPVWTDNEFLKPIPKEDNPFIREQGLEGKFVVMYSGNLGKSHPVEVMLELAAEMRHEDVFFLIIGQGDKLESVADRIKESHLKNIRLLPWQPTDKLPLTLPAADLAMVALGDEASDLAIPSKAFSFMSAGVPLMAICPSGSTLATLVSENGLGVSVRREALGQMKEFIMKLMSEESLRNRLRENIRLASSRLTEKNAMKFLSYV